jgi:hypothetical protein
MRDPDDPSDGSEVTLTRSLVDALREEYERREPFDLVEREHAETLPRAFASGAFGRRDAEWVVQWYHRRRQMPDADRRAAEARFRENEYDAMADAIGTAAAAPDLGAKLDRLTSLTGVDVAVASAFLAFTHPSEYVAVGGREWAALREAGELDGPYPDPPTPADYGRYLEAVATVADRVGRDRWAVYRAVWRLGDR